MNLSAFQSKPFQHYLACVSIALHGMWVQRLVVAWLAHGVALTASAPAPSRWPRVAAGPSAGPVVWVPG